MSDAEPHAATALSSLRAGSSPSELRSELEASLLPALERLGGAEAGVLFVTPGGPDVAEVVSAACDVIGSENLAGATAHGVLAGGREVEGSPALAALLTRGVEALPFLIHDVTGDEHHVGEEIASHIASRLGAPVRATDLVALWPDPHATNPGPLLDGIREALAPACVVGAGASDPAADAPLQWSGRRVESGGIAGMVFRSTRPPRIGVTQACRPVTERLTVTGCQGNWITELDGRRALDVYTEVARAPLAADLRRAAAFLLVALPMSSAGPLTPGSYLVRNVAGIEPEHGALAIPGLVQKGQQIAFAAREPETAREDLKAVLQSLAGEQAAFGLYLNCCARGAGFFGVPGLESAYLESSLGTTPVAGMFGAFEVGPIGTTTELLTYTGVLALVDV